MARSSSLHTLVGLRDRQFADMAAARADAVDAAPESKVHALRADAAPMQEVADDAIARKRKLDERMAKLDAEVAEYEVRREQCVLPHEEIGVRRRELRARGVEADAKMEAAQQALEEARQKRRLAEAEAKQKAQLQEARQAPLLSCPLQSLLRGLHLGIGFDTSSSQLSATDAMGIASFGTKKIVRSCTRSRRRSSRRGARLLADRRRCDSSSSVQTWP